MLTGPYTLAASAGLDGEATTLLALRLHDELLALARAGCTLAVIDEPAATGIGADTVARRRFRDAQAALLGDDLPLHAMLAITGGLGVGGGAGDDPRGAVRVLPVRPHRGPRQLVSRARRPGDRGIVCAALRGRRHPATRRRSSSGRLATPLLRTAAGRTGWASPTRRRSLGLDVPAARASLEAIARAARLAAMDPSDAVAAGLDRRTFAQPPGRGARPRRMSGR